MSAPFPGQASTYPMGSTFGGLQPSAGFNRSGLNNTPTAIPFTGTSQWGVPGNQQPQTANVQSTSGTNPVMAANQALSNGPGSNPAFVAVVMMSIGIIILGLLAHSEVTR